MTIHLGGLISLYTNASGQAYFANALPDHTYSYTIEKDWYLPVSGQLTITQAGQEFSFVLDVSTAIQDIVDDGPMPVIGPNPAQDQLQVKTTEGSTIAGYRITDVSGKTILREKRLASNTLDISLDGLAPGVYFLVLDTLNDTITLRFVKN